MKKFRYVPALLAVCVLALAGCTSPTSSTPTTATTTTTPTNIPSEVGVYLLNNSVWSQSLDGDITTGIVAGTPLAFSFPGPLANPGSYDLFRVEISWPTSVALGTVVTFTVSGVALTATGTTNPAVIPAVTAGGLSWHVQGFPVNNYSAPSSDSVVDNGNGTYTVTGTVVDGTASGGTGFARDVMIEWQLASTSIPVSAYGVNVTF